MTDPALLGTGCEPLQPPFAYFGGKMTLASTIVALLPEHGHYVEPFAGSLAVLLAKPPSKMETVNDLDGDLMLFWRVLRDRPDELIRACALTPHSRAELDAARVPAVDELERARQVWTMLTQGRGGRLSRTGWRYSVAAGAGIGMPGYLDGYVERMDAVARRLHRVSLECLPALDVIATYGRDPDVLLYVDPPYEGVTRPNSRNVYRHELTDTGEHRELLTMLLDCQASVVLSGYRSPLYDEMLADWDHLDVAAQTGHAPSGGRARTEVLWSNRLLHEGRLPL